MEAESISMLLLICIAHAISNETTDFSYGYTEETSATVDEWLLIATNVTEWTDYETVNATDDVSHSSEPVTEVTSEPESKSRTLSILSSCFDYLNTSSANQTYLNENPREPFIVLLGEDKAPCLQMDMHVLVQVNLLRSKLLFEKWSAAYFSTPLGDNVHVTGECDKDGEAQLQVAWDEYALSWRFLKKADSWYLRSLEFFTSKSDWFAKYGFGDEPCWKFKYESESMLESALDKPYHACKQSVLRLATKDDSLSAFVFLLKNKFQVQAFLKNDTYYNDWLC